LPTGLRGLTGQLRANFPFPNYRLDSTYVGRLGGSGTFEYKSISNTIGSGPDSDTPTFLEWTLGNLRTSSDGKTMYQAEPFRFGARVPVLELADHRDGHQGMGRDPPQASRALRDRARSARGRDQAHASTAA